MNKLKLFAATVLLGIGFAATGAPVKAAEQCHVEPTIQPPTLLDLKNKSMVLNGNMIDVKVSVFGEADCKKAVSVATWKWYNESGTPLESQVLYKTATQTFGVGTHTISVEVPNCRWQADLVEGTRPTAADGTASYKIGEPNDVTDRLMDFSFGYTQPVCKDDVPAPTPTDSITPAVTRLPNTGATDILSSTLVLSTATGIGYSLIRRRRLNK